MLKTGANGITAKELETALGFSKNQKQFTENYAKIVKDIQVNT